MGFFQKSELTHVDNSVCAACDNPAMSTSTENLATTQRYLRGIENGSFADVKALVAPNIVMEQLPNRIYPKGLRGTLSEMESAFEKGRTLLSKQSYEIKRAVAEGNTVAVEVLWTGTLAVGFGTLAAGSQMRCHSAMFFKFEEGKINLQRNYDCFEPW